MTMIFGLHGDLELSIGNLLAVTARNCTLRKWQSRDGLFKDEIQRTRTLIDKSEMMLQSARVSSKGN